jgi:hypothetical protein
LHARAAGLIAVFLLALAPALAEASRKLSVSSLDVPATAQAGQPLEISGTLNNSGDQKARATVRAYLKDTVGQSRLGGRKLGVGAGRNRKFSLSPLLPLGVPDGDYEILACARRLNKDGPVHCRSAPLTVEG